jgi:hypothetical protein
MKLTIFEAKQNLIEVIKNNLILEEQGLKPIALNLEGRAGIGKTQAVKQLGNPNIKINGEGITVHKISLSNIEEIGDIVGMPIKEYETVISSGNTQTLSWIPESITSGKQLTGKTRMGYAVPTWVQKGLDSNSKYNVLYLDDFSRCLPHVNQAIMDIIEDGEYLSWKLPKGWTIILSSNPEGDYNVTNSDAAQASRYITWQIKFDKETWCNYALHTGIDSRAVNFILAHGDELITDDGKNDKINPRMLTKFFNSIRHIKDFAETKSRQYTNLMASTSLGESFANIFNMFVQDNLDKLPDPKDLLNMKKYDEMKKLILESIMKNGKERTDVTAILMFRIANYMINSETKIKKEEVQMAAKLLIDKDIKEDLSFGICNRIATSKKKNLISRILNEEPRIDKKLID